MRSVIEYPWLEYNESNLPHNSAGAVMSVNRPNTFVRGATNIYHVCVDTPCLPGASVNAADEYWRTSAPRLLNAIGSTAVSGSAGSLQFSTFEYDAPRGTGNLRWERHWDDTKPGSSPTTPLNAGNSVGTNRTYGTGGILLTETDPNGNTTSYAYGGGSSHPYPTSVTQSSAPGESLAWALGWDAATGLRTSETDPNSSQTTADYDRRGRIRLLKQGTNARQTETLYDDANRTITTKSDLNSFEDGAIQSVRYLDTLGQTYRTRQIDDDGVNWIETRSFRRPSSGFTYQLASNPYRSTSDPTMGWTLTKLDKNGRVSEVEYFSGSGKPVPWGTSTNSTGIKQMVYDGEVTKARDEAGKWTYRTSDAQGRLEKVTEDPGGLGYITTYTYDALDDLKVVSQNGQQRAFNYTSLKRLLNATNPESGTIGYIYDNNGNLLTRADARGIVTTMAYDGMNRVKTKSYSDSTPAITYAYDGCTNGASRLCSVSSSASATGFSYDALGRVTASTQTTSGTAYNFGYQYKLNDGLKQITYPSQRVVTYAYTGAGRVASMSGVLDGTTTNYTDPNTSISYFPHGGLNSLKLASQLVEQHCYNPRLQATGIRLGTSIATNCANSSDLLNIGLDFGATQNNGNLQTQTIIRGSQTWSQTYTSCYDGVNRLTCASESGAGTWSQTYGYDAFGNRWVNGTGLPSQTNQVPNANWYLLVADNSTNNKVVSSPHGDWNYDAAGNLKAMSGMPGWGFDYDAENRQISAVTANSPTTTYKYDGEGRRVSKTWNGQTTTFVYDAFGNLAAEYGGPVDSHGTHYLTSDHLGSTRLVTNSSGAAVKCYDYLPFGEEIGTTAGRPSCFGSGSYPVSGGATNVEFTSKERDAETGLDFFGARYFSAAQGRFTSPDPNSAGASLFDPQSWNAYSYVNNRSLNNIDPDGDVPLPVITGLGGGLIGGAVSAYWEYRAQQKLSPEERQTAKIWTAFGGGFVSGGLAGLGLGGLAASGVAVGVGTTAMVEGASSVIGGYAQRRTDEALGHSRPPNSETSEIIADGLSGGLGGAVGGKLGEKLIPLPNIRRELEILSFAHRRSQRNTLKGAAQLEFDRRAIANTALGETAENVVFTPFVRSVFDWLFRRPQEKVESTFRPCAEGDKSEGCK